MILKRLLPLSYSSVDRPKEDEPLEELCEIAFWEVNVVTEECELNHGSNVWMFGLSWHCFRGWFHKGTPVRKWTSEVRLSQSDSFIFWLKFAFRLCETGPSNQLHRPTAKSFIGLLQKHFLWWYSWRHCNFASLQIYVWWYTGFCSLCRATLKTCGLAKLWSLLEWGPCILAASLSYMLS